MRVFLFSLCVALGVLTIGCQALAPHGPQALASFTENSVKVDLSFEPTAQGKGWLVGTFTPTLEGFHLYSKDLPKMGKYGLGRPTLIERMTPQGAVSLGTLVANQPTEGNYNRALNFSLEVYPDGPVTLKVLLDGSTPLPNELAVTYMACSIQNCLAPVVEKKVEININD